MIQASELRIGNYVLNAGGKSIKVTSQRIADIENKIVIAKPIELSEEILLKCGFALKQHDTSCSITIAKKKLIILHSLKSRKQWIFQSYTVNLQYLHQLQNLYFALTQTELEINL